MIETMKKVRIVCLATARDAAVKTMQRLGSLHVVPDRPAASDGLQQARDKQDKLRKALDELTHRRVTPAMPVPEEDADAVLEKTLNAIDRLQEARDSEVAARKGLELIRPWGSFDAQKIKELAQNGLYVELCTLDKKAFASGSAFKDLADAAVCKIATFGNRVYFALISRTSLADRPLPRAELPECTSSSDLKTAITRAMEIQVAMNSSLDNLATIAIPALQSRLREIDDDVAFLAARDGMGESGCLAYISGYVPECKLDDLLAVARKCGWAVRYEDIPDGDTVVPTLLRIPRRFQMAQAIFDAVGILPGYFETDVSISVYVFLSLFCGMLIGDAGYGAILSLTTWYFLKKATTREARNGLIVLLSLSLCTFVFGWLSGNWFGIPNSALCVPFCGIPWLAQDATQNHIKLLCFFVGAVHTSLAHIWLACKARRNMREVIGNAGWAFFLWANFLAVAKLVAGGISCPDSVMYAFYGIGFLGILTCSINWRSFGDVIYSPFSFINSFVDILSYIRLFAVGLSGIYIADSFNKMAASFWNISPWLIPVGLLVLLIGHLLNIAMAALSILVHGIRLNTLEFSGHIGLTWSGNPYKPLKQTARR